MKYLRPAKKGEHKKSSLSPEEGGGVSLKPFFLSFFWVSGICSNPPFLPPFPFPPYLTLPRRERDAPEIN